MTEDDEWQMVMSSYLSIVSRVLILNQMMFIQVLQGLNIPAPFETFMDIWLRKMPLIGQSDKRKLLSKPNISSHWSMYLQFCSIVVRVFLFLHVRFGSGKSINCSR